jgi:hypothetical protein
VSLPTGAAIVAVHSSPPAEVLQFGEAGVRFCVTGVPPSTEIVSDCVLGETYCGRRLVLAVVFAGTVMTKRACELGLAPAGPAGTPEGNGPCSFPPPAVQAEIENAAMSSANFGATADAVRFISVTSPHGLK